MGQEQQLPPVMAGIFTPAEGGRLPSLLGRRCPACALVFFHPRSHCPSCLGPMETVDLGGRGELHSFTVVRTKAPLGLPQPYGVGFVDLPQDGPRVFCLLDPGALDRLRLGQAVRLAVAPLGHDQQGRPCLRPYFTPDGD